MKVGDRQQQGRTKGDDRTGTNPREKCPACQTYYLKTFYVKNGTTWIKNGKVCPNELCTFCRKDKEE